MENRENIWERIDYSLVFILFLLFCISCFVLSSAQSAHLIASNFLKEQIILYVLSIPFFLVAVFIDLDVIERVSTYIYLICIVFMLGILIMPDSIAPVINGAKGWYRLGPISIQPAEFMKIGLILAVSSKLARLQEDDQEFITTKDEFIFIGKLLLYLVPLVFFAKQYPDLGSLLVDSSIFITILFVSKIRVKTIMILVLPVIILISGLILLYFLNPNVFFNDILSHLPSYQAQRFYGWLDPNRFTNSDGYQLQTSLNAIGSGELSGASMANFSVPYAYSDFVFSIVGGKWGMLGASFLILTYFVLLYRILKISLESHSPYGALVCAGVIGMFAYQIFQNIGMTIGILPITGLGLPFISYGGSSLFISMFAVGLVLNVKINTYKFMFN
ncbi:FtsW/RodA/SpoVE family cell cycle protein [Sporolactobacillus spathodeae]|uniref:Rod shape determining protein RodA n=1 Tax=Sporolactobacillus spathodeae TaxID=1465502 RepID=A0ABS2Q8D9_9BACL|nr:FtsW/RodA/SpoVE family cell cycle protein [Sporolactobacillus spathodeae]MBM7658058.1 rod shape determining protein RodA [Sporolactobacillus spathodeae]